MVPVKQLNPKDVAFVIASCDKYSILWPSFFKCLDKYWSDCPFDIFLVTNDLDISWHNIKVLKTGIDNSYSDNLLIALNQVEHDWIILWLDDYFLSENVENERLLEMLNHVQLNGGGYLKLATDMPMAYKSDLGDEVGPLPKNIKYRSAIGAAFYRKDILVRLLIPQQSAWDPDRSELSNKMSEQFYALTPHSAKNPPIKYKHLLIKGKWLLDSLKFLREEGLDELIKYRDKQSVSNYIYAKMYLLRLYFLRLFRVHWK